VLVEQVIAQLQAWGVAGVAEQDGIREQVVFPLPRELGARAAS
jgi:4-hydroxy-3-methylbut-2-enyl diphosphate reductase